MKIPSLLTKLETEARRLGLEYWWESSPSGSTYFHVRAEFGEAVARFSNHTRQLSAIINHYAPAHEQVRRDWRFDSRAAVRWLRRFAAREGRPPVPPPWVVNAERRAAEERRRMARRILEEALIRAERVGNKRKVENIRRELERIQQ